MHKQEVLFQPWAMWYCHNHPDKTVGNAEAINVTKDFACHTKHRKRQTLRQLSGIMTNNQFSSLHAHSEIVTVLDMAVASGPAGPVLAGPLFHSNKKKKFFLGFHQCFMAWQRKSLKCSTDFSHAFTSPRDSKLDIQGVETRPAHGMETGLTRATLQHKTNHADRYRACFAAPNCGVLVSFLCEEVLSRLQEMARRTKSESAVYAYGSSQQTSRPSISTSWSPDQPIYCETALSRAPR